MIALQNHVNVKGFVQHRADAAIMIWVTLTIKLFV
jgi:hypothetical protein